MRVEINLNEKDNENACNGAGQQHLPEAVPGAVACDVAIDIGQVLAANQALLKNMARKMEAMETRLGSMERIFNEQAARLADERRTVLLLTGPTREVKPWEPPARKSVEEHAAKFSMFDRIFRPWRLRRQ